MRRSRRPKKQEGPYLSTKQRSINICSSWLLIPGLFIVFLLVCIYSPWPEPESSSPAEGAHERCQWPPRSRTFYGEKRIMNGKRPVHVKWPWFVRLVNGSDGCGGSLVSDRHVLTAAHCFDDTEPVEDYWWVYVGVVRRKELSKPYKIKEIILHKDYDKDSIVNDIALLTLIQPVQFSDSISAVCLPLPGRAFPPGTKCWVAGFGKTNLGRHSSDLLEVSVNIIEQSVCNSQHVHNGMILQSMLCAGDLNGGPDACGGDSGGPLVCEGHDGFWYLAGIVSWGVDCGRPNTPGVYTNVSHYVKWIREKMSMSFGSEQSL